MLEELNGRDGAVGERCAAVEGFYQGCRPAEIRFAVVRVVKNPKSRTQKLSNSKVYKEMKNKINLQDGIQKELMNI